MNILLIAANKLKIPRPALPLGLALLTSSLEAKGHSVKCVDLSFSMNDNKVLKDAITSHKPGLIGISVRNLDNLCYLDPVFFAKDIRKVIKICQKLTSTPIILGGTGFSISPGEMLCYTDVNYGIRGEGEKSLVLFVDYLQGKQKLENIPGLYYRKNGTVHNNEIAYINNLNTLNIPNREIFDNKYFKYRIPSLLTDELNSEQNNLQTLQTKRGCSLNCVYCCVKKTQGATERTKDAKHVVEEMKKIATDYPHIKEIEFVDSTFNIPQEHSVEICNEIIKSGLNIKWSCQLTNKNITKDFIDLLEKAGCYRIELGTDALSEKGLENMRKDFDMSTVFNIDKMFSQTSMNVTHCIFFGVPGDNEKTVKESLSNLQKLKSTQFYFNFGIRILEGTELAHISKKEGIIDSSTDLFVPHYYISPEIIDNKKMVDAIQTEVLKQKNFYMWYGLSRFSLFERVQQVKEELGKMKSDYQYIMNNKNHTER